ncbi:lysylphosphatidylglycerol synthetase-like protein (DUF2156 family) [Mycobacteroides chelonae]|nr:lysylphosphatidylglycerol synthetase-like protein (DUF2156 family) [Mycobacteroides chelonae]
MIARDHRGVVQGFHRYATTIDMITLAKTEGARRLSLAFAAYPEIFAEKERTRVRQVCYSAIHVLVQMSTCRWSPSHS